MKDKRGFTVVELLVVMAIIALLIGLLLPALTKARAQAKLLEDGTQMKQIHVAWLTFAGGCAGIMPTPGLIDRKKIDLNDGRGPRQVPGRGEEDTRQNTTANIHSACIGSRDGDPENGDLNVESHITYEIHGGRKQWVGVACYNDNHIEVHHTFVTEGVEYSRNGERRPDNLFRNDTDPGGNLGDDIWLVVVDSCGGFQLTWD